MQRGFVRKRGSTWTAYYHVTASGERRQFSKGGFRTKSDAHAFLTRTLSELQRGNFVEPTKLTVAEYLLDRWLPIMEHVIRPSTWDSYKRMIERHIIPAFGHKALQALTADDLDRLYARLLSSGSIRGDRGLSPKTVRYLHNTLHKALRDAERKQLVLRNVASAADPPKARQVGGREMQTWTAEQLRAFLDATTEHRMHPAFLLAATTGMRRGEVLGVRWADIDFATRRLAVRQTVLSVNYKLSFGSPKTARGRRVIALDGATVSVLERHRVRQQAERALLEAGYQDHGLVFARLDGNPIHPDYFTQAFDRVVAKLDLPRIRLHDLRHTHATLGLAAGVPPRVMADRLGHATVAFTQDIYMHAIPRLEEHAADQVAELIFGTAKAV